MAEYEREKLYKEVWDEPVSTVAKRYCVSDVAIRKICWVIVCWYLFWCHFISLFLKNFALISVEQLLCHSVV